MTMLEILQQRLPEGLEIVKVQSRANASQTKIWFSFDGDTKIGYLPKTCVPGKAEKICDFTICSTMCGFALQRKDLEKASYWLKKQDETFKLEEN